MSLTFEHTDVYGFEHALRGMRNPLVTYTDRDAFEEAIFDRIEDLTGYYDRSEEWYRKETKRIAKVYEPFWKPCILVTVGN